MLVAKGRKINKAHPLAQGLIAYWRMDEGCGTVVNDYSENNKKGTLVNFDLSGNASNWCGSNTGSGVMFDGVNDYIEIPSNVAFDGTTGTWMGWVRSSMTIVTGAAIMGRVSPAGSSGGINVFYYGATQLRAQIKTVAGTSVLDVYPSGAIANAWNHWAITFNGTNLFSFYINGRLRATGTPSATWSFNSQVIRFGTSVGTYWDKLLGAQTEVRVYNRILTQTEIRQLYTDPHADMLGIKYK